MSATNDASEDAKNMALLFFMDHLMQKNGARTIHDLSCQFGARGFTEQMREAVGATQDALAAFLAQYPSLFQLDGDRVTINGYGGLLDGADAQSSPLVQAIVRPRDRDYEREAIEFFEVKLRKFGPELLIKSLLGHRSQAAPEIRLVSGRHLRDFADFLARFPDNFVVRGDRVRLLNVPEPAAPDLGLDDGGQPLVGERARQAALEFLRQVVEQQDDVPLPLDALYERFCQRFPYSVKQDVATNPKELLQFLKLNRAVFFIRSNKVSLVRNRPDADDGFSSPSDASETRLSSPASSSRDDDAHSPLLVKALRPAQEAVKRLTASEAAGGGGVIAADFKFVRVDAASAELLSVVVLAPASGRAVVFDVAHSDAVLTESGLGALLASPHWLKVIHDARKISATLMHRYNVKLQHVFDTQVRRRRLSG